jgi:hypothetical protein
MNPASSIRRNRCPLPTLMRFHLQRSLVARAMVKSDRKAMARFLQSGGRVDNASRLLARPTFMGLIARLPCAGQAVAAGEFGPSLGSLGKTWAHESHSHDTPAVHCRTLSYTVVNTDPCELHDEPPWADHTACFG